MCVKIKEWFQFVFRELFFSFNLFSAGRYLNECIQKAQKLSVRKSSVYWHYYVKAAYFLRQHLIQVSYLHVYMKINEIMANI